MIKTFDSKTFPSQVFNCHIHKWRLEVPPNGIHSFFQPSSSQRLFWMIWCEALISQIIGPWQEWLRKMTPVRTLASCKSIYHQPPQLTFSFVFILCQKTLKLVKFFSSHFPLKFLYHTAPPIFIFFLLSGSLSDKRISKFYPKIFQRIRTRVMIIMNGLSRKSGPSFYFFHHNEGNGDTCKIKYELKSCLHASTFSCPTFHPLTPISIWNWMGDNLANFLPLPYSIHIHIFRQGRQPTNRINVEHQINHQKLETWLAR